MGLADSFGTLRELVGGVEGIDLTPYDEFGASLASFEEGSAARVAQLEEQIAVLSAENSRLKAVNYDLLMTGQGEAEAEPEPEDEVDEGDDSPNIEDYED